MDQWGRMLRAAHGAPLAALAAQPVLLAALAATAGLGPPGWSVGLACGVGGGLLFARALHRHGTVRLGPAGWLTLARATLAVGVAALAAEALAGAGSTTALVALAAVALTLDYVDGRVARRTGTVSELGGRLDGEVDAFLIAALAVDVAPKVGGWVLAIGAARYAFLAAGWAVEWMRAPLPRRDWRKRVTAAQGLTLTAAAAAVVPMAAVRVALAVALLLLAESFGRDVRWLWRHRDAPAPAGAPAGRPSSPAAVAAGSGGGRTRAPVQTALTVLAFLAVWLVLVAPNQPSRLSLEAFIRLPIEGVVVVGLAVALPVRARRALAAVVGPLLGLLVFVKLLDIGFFMAFDRPFNPTDDWRYTRIGIETLHESVGRTTGNLALVGVVALLALGLALPTLAVYRVTGAAAGHRRTSLRAVGVLALAWVVCWTSGLHLLAGEPIASTSAAELAVHEVRAVKLGLEDRARFAAQIRRDRYRGAPGARLLTALRGKDVLLVFVESYGKVAVEGSSFSPGVDAVLDAGTSQLRSAGFSSRSGWLTSPTFGGISWLAHSTMEAGVWVNTQGRYDQLVASPRMTLSDAFGRAGWRTVGDVPSDNRHWPEGTGFYHYDRVYDRRDVGYRGPTYAYASMPDQYVYLALQRLELARRDRPPLFAEVDLVSSHEPWTQIPPLIPWSQVGDGSVFYRLPVDMTGNGDTKAAYGRSIQYTLRTLFSFVRHYGRRNLVMVVLGDHQPAAIVSGEGASHQVPISVIAHDPSVMARISGWGWVDGMRPGSTAPVWPMSAFRDRFLSAFGPRPGRP
jgi:phosphatidylglycerophosphate synthase